MEFRTAIQALSIAFAVGSLFRIIFEMALLHQLNVISLAVCIFAWFVIFKHNDLFWEVIEKIKRS